VYSLQTSVHERCVTQIPLISEGNPVKKEREWETWAYNTRQGVSDPSRMKPAP
jgi:hypothetical protein